MIVVDLALVAGGVDDAGRADPLDRLADQLDVAAHQRRVPVVGEQHPLAAELVVGRRLGEQFGVGQALAAKAVGELGDVVGDPVGAGEGVGQRLDHAEHPGSRGRDPGRHALHQLLLPLRVGAVHLRQDPWCRALVDIDPLGDFRDLRDELNRARPGADHRDPAAAQVLIVVPVGRVEDAALELLDPVDRGEGRVGQLPAGGDDGLELVLVAGRCAHRPDAGVRVEVGALDLGLELDVRSQAEVVGELVEVVEDVGARGVSPASSGARARRRTSTGGRARRRRRRDSCSRARRRRPSRRARRS